MRVRSDEETQSNEEGGGAMTSVVIHARIPAAHRVVLAFPLQS